MCAFLLFFRSLRSSFRCYLCCLSTHFRFLGDSFEQLPELSEKGKDFIATPVSLDLSTFFFSDVIWRLRKALIALYMYIRIKSDEN